jgi:hypothetical protein
MLTFVYVKGLRGPEPQLWHDKPTNGSGASKSPLQSTELPDSYATLSLDLLAHCYPYKGAPHVA